jgi:hypothetical protein
VRKTLVKVAASNLVLWSLALAVSCGCLCSSKPTTVGSAASRAPGQASDDKRVESWRFAVSGDSRNCGDVVMPAIAAGAKLDGAQFYWHLGDLRAIYDFDQDMVQAAKIAGGKPLTISDYEQKAWDDFTANQIAPFENIPMPFYLGIGNHETISPKTRCEFAKTFARFLDKPELQDGHVPAQSSQPGANQGTGKTSKPNTGADAQSDSLKECTQECEECSRIEPKTYYHWSYPRDKPTVDFIYLDNATKKQFDQAQMDWFDGVINRDADDKSITTVVVGMHKALPWSVTCDHSMNESPRGIESGEEVYRRLLDLQKKNKKVYVLASHSHYYMQDIFNTRHWLHEGVLPGWIIGTAGAQRYPLPPPPIADLTKSKTYVYGYLLARVYSDGTIDFAFTELKDSDIPTEVRNRYTESWIGEACFDGNRNTDPFIDRDYCKDSTVQK